MIEEIIYECHNDEDCKEAAELTGLNHDPYGLPRGVYPYYIGIYYRKDGVRQKVSTAMTDKMQMKSWTELIIKLPAIDLYKRLGMKT